MKEAVVLPSGPEVPKLDNMEPPAVSPPTRNHEGLWDAFDSGAYSDENYSDLREDDRMIAEKVRDFFATCDLGPGVHGVDVGAGSNLYPSLAMLPFCDRLDLNEFSTSNVEWLRAEQRDGFDPRWDKFWQIYTEHPVYARYAADHDPRVEFSHKAIISQGSIFALPTGEWDVGVMFFVACSLSTDEQEFRDAVHCFVRSLKAGAPFAAAFMTGSRGYCVADRLFPAVPIDMEAVTRSLEPVAYDLKVEEIVGDRPLRPGVGMLLALGRASGG